MECPGWSVMDGVSLGIIECPGHSWTVYWTFLDIIGQFPGQYWTLLDSFLEYLGVSWIFLESPGHSWMQFPGVSWLDKSILLSNIA
jgi:hypothetical protein